jgi:thiopeptide-type bacteriocin biosynthesis protein
VWQSYHLFPALGTCDEMLLHCIPPFLSTEHRDHSLRRAFFLRYDEGGHHLRLRLQYRPSGAGVMDRLQLALDASRVEARVEASAYSRDDHYYGDTLETVYAELLNVRSSALAMEQLVSKSDRFTTRQGAWALWGVASAVQVLQAASEEWRSGIRACSEFVESAIQTFEARVAAQTALRDSTIEPERFRAVLCARPQLSLQGANFARLLRRTVRCKASGWRVGTHAMHLYMNKLGVPLPVEGQAWGAASRWAENAAQDGDT